MNRDGEQVGGAGQIARIGGGLWLCVGLLSGAACSSLPEPKIPHHEFPKSAFFGEVKRPYDKLGLVRTKVNYKSVDARFDDQEACKNYFNKAVADLVKRAKDKGGDAVVDVKSVTFLMDGRVETYPSAQCTDDGEGGQVLAQGIAVKWKPGTESYDENGRPVKKQKRIIRVPREKVMGDLEHSAIKRAEPRPRRTPRAPDPSDEPSYADPEIRVGNSYPEQGGRMKTLREMDDEAEGEMPAGDGTAPEVPIQSNRGAVRSMKPTDPVGR